MKKWITGIIVLAFVMSAISVFADSRYDDSIISKDKVERDINLSDPVDRYNEQFGRPEVENMRECDYYKCRAKLFDYFLLEGSYPCGCVDVCFQVAYDLAIDIDFSSYTNDLEKKMYGNLCDYNEAKSCTREAPQSMIEKFTAKG